MRQQHIPSLDVDTIDETITTGFAGMRISMLLIGQVQGGYCTRKEERYRETHCTKRRNLKGLPTWG